MVQNLCHVLIFIPSWSKETMLDSNFMSFPLTPVSLAPTQISGWLVQPRGIWQSNHTWANSSQGCTTWILFFFYELKQEKVSTMHTPGPSNNESHAIIWTRGNKLDSPSSCLIRFAWSYIASTYLPGPVAVRPSWSVASGEPLQLCARLAPRSPCGSISVPGGGVSRCRSRVYDQEVSN